MYIFINQPYNFTIITFEIKFTHGFCLFVRTKNLENMRKEDLEQR